MAVSFFIAVLLVRKGMVKDGRFSAYLKLFGGISVVMVIFSIIPIMTITYFLPGVPSSYAAPYEYTSGSSKSCSGANVNDPDLGTRIRICYPDGNYEYNNIIYVEKRNNQLGTVVTYATTMRRDYD